MQFGLFTCGYQRLPLECAFADAAQMGYDYIELWGGYPHAYAPDIVGGLYREVRDLSNRWHMPILVYTPEHNAYPYNFMLGSPRQWQNCMEYLTTAMMAAKLLGVEYMLVSVGHGGDACAAVREKRLLSSLRYLTRQAENIGITLLLETLTPLESNICTRLEELNHVLRQISSEALCGMCDVVPPFLQGEDPVDYQRQLGNRLRHLHLVDCDGRTETHLIPGDGVMDLRGLVAGFREAGYDATATLELVTNYIENPSLAARLALQRTKNLL